MEGESEEEIWVDFEIGDLELTANRMATPTEDYYLVGAASGVFSGTIDFAPGETSVQFDIGLVNDTPYEGLEWLSIQLSNPVNAQIGDEYDEYTQDIWIDDVEDPYIVVSNIEVLEPLDPEETAYASFRVEMVGGSGLVSSEVSWTTMVDPADTATAGDDRANASSAALSIVGRGLARVKASSEQFSVKRKEPGFSRRCWHGGACFGDGVVL
jgi:hypothetical protein